MRWPRPRAPRKCLCPEHVDDVIDLPIPVTTWARNAGICESLTLRDILDVALTAAPLQRRHRWVTVYSDGTRPCEPRRIGPFHWTIGIGDEARPCYDDDAEFSLQQAFLAQPPVERVERTEREELLIGAPTLCRSGMLATATRALTDPRIRR
jgi:hypothetical protein